jgi:hypothetical protein
MSFFAGGVEAAAGTPAFGASAFGAALLGGAGAVDGGAARWGGALAGVSSCAAIGGCDGGLGEAGAGTVGATIPPSGGTALCAGSAGGVGFTPLQPTISSTSNHPKLAIRMRGGPA